MSRRFVVTPAAEHDLANAYDWYESKRAGLGGQFLDFVGEELARIERDPETWPQTYKTVRQVLV